MEPQKDYNTNFMEQLSDENLIYSLSPQKKQDVLSIVFDAINSVVSGVIITDLNGFICFANPSFCKMFEYMQEDIIGKNAAELFTTKEIRTFSDLISIIDISKDDTEEFIVKKSDDSTFIVEVSGTNVTSADNQLSGRMASFTDITQKKEIENDREKLISKLQNALDTIKTLKGIIPICSYCKKIRDDKGAWDKMEAYLSAHSEAQFTHGICPECYETMMKEME
ncbi:PAS/PAC sensor protein [Candidatus Magnetomorum sp. HK-1]|nr:PAS/PAC sensor protein [Candidatus Magnetomorum sp. HK-1]